MYLCECMSVYIYICLCWCACVCMCMCICMCMFYYLFIYSLFTHYSFCFLFHCFYCCFQFGFGQFRFNTIRSRCYDSIVLSLNGQLYQVHNMHVNFRYHFIVSHFILVICSKPRLIVHLIYKKIFHKILSSKKDLRKTTRRNIIGI